MRPNSVRALARNPYTNQYQQVKYAFGEVVETKIVYSARARTEEKWVAATISKFHRSDNTWDVEVLEPAKHRVHPIAVHVPDAFIRKAQSTPYGAPDIPPPPK